MKGSEAAPQEEHEVETMDLGLDLGSTAVQPQESHLPSLDLSFHACKIGGLL